MAQSLEQKDENTSTSSSDYHPHSSPYNLAAAISNTSIQNEYINHNENIQSDLAQLPPLITEHINQPESLLSIEHQSRGPSHVHPNFAEQYHQYTEGSNDIFHNLYLVRLQNEEATQCLKSLLKEQYKKEEKVIDYLNNIKKETIQIAQEIQDIQNQLKNKIQIIDNQIDRHLFYTCKQIQMIKSRLS